MYNAPTLPKGKVPQLPEPPIGSSQAHDRPEKKKEMAASPLPFRGSHGQNFPVGTCGLLRLVPLATNLAGGAGGGGASRPGTGGVAHPVCVEQTRHSTGVTGSP